MTTFVWKVTSLDCLTQKEDKQNVVFMIHWRCTATHQVEEQNISVENYGTASVSYNPENPFVVYEQLTEPDVLSWVWSSIDKQSVENNLQNQIDEKLAPTVVKPMLPWAEPA